MLGNNVLMFAMEFSSRSYVHWFKRVHLGRLMPKKPLEHTFETHFQCAIRMAIKQAMSIYTGFTEHSHQSSIHNDSP